LVEDEVRRRAGDPSYKAAATLACTPGFGKPASVSAEIAGFSCARGKTGLTVGPGCQWSRATRGENGRAERSAELGCGCGPRASGRVRLGGPGDAALRAGRACSLGQCGAKASGREWAEWPRRWQGESWAARAVREGKEREVRAWVWFGPGSRV